MPSFRLIPGSLVIICLLAPSLAMAQPSDRGPRLAGTVSGAFGDGGPAQSFDLSAGYRFTPRLGVEFSGAYLGGLDFGDFPVCGPAQLCILGGAYSLEGRAASLSLNLVADLPGGPSWVRPYLTAGGGIASVRLTQVDRLVSGRRITTATSPLLALGGGVDFVVWRGLAFGVDVRHQRISDADDSGTPQFPQRLSLTRLGSSVSYRF